MRKGTEVATDLTASLTFGALGNCSGKPQMEIIVFVSVVSAEIVLPRTAGRLRCGARSHRVHVI